MHVSRQMWQKTRFVTDHVRLPTSPTHNRCGLPNTTITAFSKTNTTDKSYIIVTISRCVSYHKVLYRVGRFILFQNDNVESHPSQIKCTTDDSMVKMSSAQPEVALSAVDGGQSKMTSSTVTMETERGSDAAEEDENVSPLLNVS